MIIIDKIKKYIKELCNSDPKDNPLDMLDIIMIVCVMVVIVTLIIAEC
jgi:hypothetical protein